MTVTMYARMTEIEVYISNSHAASSIASTAQLQIMSLPTFLRMLLQS